MDDARDPASPDPAAGEPSAPGVPPYADPSSTAPPSTPPPSAAPPSAAPPGAASTGASAAAAPTATAAPRPAPGFPNAPAAMRPYGPPPASLPLAEPGPVTIAMREFWAARLTPVPPQVLVAAGATGVVGGSLVVGHDPGLGLALVGLLVWSAAVPVLVRRRAVADLVTATLAMALVAVVALRDAEWVVAVSLLTAAVVAAVAATSARTWAAALLSPWAVAVGAVRALPWLRHGLGARVGSRRGQVLVALRSVALTALILLVFGLLFASADPVFASFLPRLDGTLLPAQVVVGLLAAGATATAAHLVLAPPRWSAITVRPGRPARRGEWLLPVLALDTLVLGFVAVQVSALAGGHQHVLETAGLTYAEYAREGFAQLVAATALTLVVIAVAVRRAPRGGARDALVVGVSLALLGAGTLGVVASAVRRMSLYVDAFGLTRLRIFVVVAEVVLGVVVVLVVVAGLRGRGTWLPRAVVQVVAVAVLGLALVNPDALIVRHNVSADLVNGKDVQYLRGLSADAVPAMAELTEPWRSCLLSSVDVGASTGLGGWNLSRTAAVTALDDGPPVDAADGAVCTQVQAGRP